MDLIDQKILRILQKDARTPLKAIAAEVYLSSPAVSARIEKLEEQGYIQGYTIRIDRRKLGYGITAFVEVSVEPGRQAEFARFADAQAHVLECCHITGDFSMLLKVAFRSTHDLETFVGRLQEWGHTRTQIVFSAPVKTREITVLPEEK